MDKLEQKRKGGTGDGDGPVSITKQKTGDQEEQSGDLLDSGTKGKQDLKNLDQSNRAGPSNEESPMVDWTEFGFYSNSGRYERKEFDMDGYYKVNKSDIFYGHWLRKDYTKLGKEEHYEEFDTLIHATTISNAQKIFEHGRLKQQVVKDSSIINPRITFYKDVNGKFPVKFKNRHPMVTTKLVWYGPYKRENLRTTSPEIERYGNAVFSMKTLYGFEGIIREPADFNFYFVEIIDYLYQSACRILVTKKEYPDLLKYDPFKKGGPWYIDGNGKHFHLNHITNAYGHYVPNTLEFMREEEESFRSMWLTNHDISYKPCSHPRKGVDISINESYDSDRLKLAMGLLAYKMECKNSFVLQQWCFLDGEKRNGEKDILDILNHSLQPLIKDYIKKDQEARLAVDKCDGLDAVEFSWLKSQAEKEPDYVDAPFSELYEWLKTKLDMKVFHIRDFIKHLLVFCKSRFFLVNGNPDPLFRFYFGSLYPLHRPMFLEKLEGIIQEDLLHNYSGHTPGFSFKSTRRLQNGELVHYWLPDDSTTLKNEEKYEEFDTLTHSTSLMNAYEIFEGGRLTPSVVSDNSIVSEDYSRELGQQRHPLAEVKLMTYHPGSRDKMKEGTFSDHHDGSVTFVMKTLDGHGGIVDRKNGKNFQYYFVEIVEHEDVCICRILVTKRLYSQLDSYDPNREGGPWYVQNGKHYLLKKIQNLQGKLVSNTVEFYREELDNKTLETSWQINHEIFYKRDKDGGNRDKDEENSEENMNENDKDEGNRDKHEGNRDNDVGNRDKDEGNWAKDEGNWDKDVGNRDKDGGNRDKGEGNRYKDEGNRERDEGNGDKYVGNRYKDEGKRDKDEGKRDKDEGNTDKDDGNTDKNGKNGDKNGRHGDGELRLALGLLACKIAQPNNIVLHQWFLLGGTNDIYEVLRDIHRNVLGEVSECNFEQNGDELYGERRKQIDDFKNMDMANFVQGILTFYQKEFFLEKVELQTIYKKLLSLVNPDRSSVFLEELEQALQEHALHRIHRKVRIRTKQNLTGFSYYIKHPGRNGDYVRHWLPKDYKDLLPEDYNASNREHYYKAFDVLMKSPDERNYTRHESCSAVELHPVLHVIDSPSVANKGSELYDDSFKKIVTHYVHPLSDANIYRYMADSLENVKNESERKKKYGEDTFRMNRLFGYEGIKRDKDNYEYYLIEVIDYIDESICRVLATNNRNRNHPGLLEIDSETEGGPFYNVTKPYKYDDVLEYLGMIRNFEGKKVKNRVEFVKEVTLPSIWVGNHTQCWED